MLFRLLRLVNVRALRTGNTGLFGQTPAAGASAGSTGLFGGGRALDDDDDDDGDDSDGDQEHVDAHFVPPPPPPLFFFDFACNSCPTETTHDNETPTRQKAIATRRLRACAFWRQQEPAAPPVDYSAQQARLQPTLQHQQAVQVVGYSEAQLQPTQQQRQQ